MKKILNLMYLCFIVVNNVSAQSTKGFPKIETEIIGQSKLSVYYQLDDNSTNKKKSGETVLQILDSKSKYFDVVESDAIAYNNAALTGELNKDNIAEGLKVFGKYVYKGVILKDFSTSKVVVNDLIGGKRFEYEESIPKIEWKIGKEQKEILGYQCTKATAKFRGRDYVVWYTDDLPISDGPFLFTGLPGLILEVRDTKNAYAFIANRIENKNEEVFLTIHPKVTKTDRGSFRRGDKNDHLDPGASLQGKIYTEPGKVTNISGMKSIPYNPIELE
ncbi:GLPGLI family protein [Myroides odoratimimus]|uniref:GLPGLI family protein n=2 Tax=Myroides TaxID=76831 RepID=A0AAI8G6Z6_9FLAO|nr:MULTISPECIES: GLPGLI family protein [Myroides]AJH14161.1 hypothetical protein MPR_0970 [Myroides profundi]ALU28333.1 hypothetical protein AS202_10395 [Myroides odoratimimus]APA92591.1 GLPGLI family protein [Myroides sp. ZB35]EKB03299.1 hypothetical protein HMPREF9711_02626 [Myroides odoratimimus CCUG 3837]EPH11330.1 hypothetical protein HMPREF9713_01816 [Myroides odoratimimus CCUG 12700]